MLAFLREQSVGHADGLTERQQRGLERLTDIVVNTLARIGSGSSIEPLVTLAQTDSVTLWTVHCLVLPVD